MLGRIKKFSPYIALFTLSLTLSSCGSEWTGSPHAKAPSFQLAPNIDRMKFVQNFPVLDSSGNVASPRVTNSSSSPFGVLLVFHPNGDVIFCTTSHIVPGKVLTNAHCVEEDNNPTDYYILYFNQQGQLVFTTATGFYFIGSSNDYDVAILGIPSAAAQNWSSVQGQIVSLQSVQRITIWSYDPLSDHQQLSNSYGNRDGMVFNPKTCLASTGSMPTIYPAGKSTPITTDQVNPSIHVIIDNCNTVPVNGNSGSLITYQGNIQALVGAFHWGIGIDNPERYSYYTYFGNNGQQILQGTKGLEFFQVGSLFSVHPEILGPAF